MDEKEEEEDIGRIDPKYYQKEKKYNINNNTGCAPMLLMICVMVVLIGIFKC